MNLPEGSHLAYIVWHEAWYAEASRTPGEHPHLMVQTAHEGGGVTWAFQIDGHELGGSLVTRVKMFDDSYGAFAQIPEFFAALADGGPATLGDIMEILDGLGAVDETPRVSPYDRREMSLRERIIASVDRAHAETPEQIADAVIAVLGASREG